MQDPSFTYVGPFFISCDHGCSHGTSQHGRWLDAEGCLDKTENDRNQARKQAATDCLKWINQAGFIFCWIEDFTAYGTLFELGYAHAQGKPIFVGLKRRPVGEGLSLELWLSLMHVQKWVETEDHRAAWAEFEAWLGRRRAIGQERKKPEPMTRKQLDDLDELIDRIPGLIVSNYDRYFQLDKVTAGRILLCLRTGGDVTLEFPNLFVLEEPTPGSS